MGLRLRNLASSFSVKSRLITVLSLGVLFIVSFVTRIALMLRVADVMYFFDSYYYFFSAWKFLNLGLLPFSRIAYVSSLSSWMFLFKGSSIDMIFYARIFTVALSAVVVCVIYLLFSKVIPKKYAFVLAIVVSLEPRFLSFSVTTHNDVFFILFALAALYLSLSKSKVLSFIAAPIFFAIAVLTSEWVFILFGPLLLLVYGIRFYASKMKRSYKFLLSVGLFLVYLVPLSLHQAWSIYLDGTRFSPLERFALFFKYDLFVYVSDTIFNVTTNQIINSVLKSFSILGGIAILIELIRSKLLFLPKKFRTNSRGTKEKILLFGIVYLFVVSLLIYTVFGMAYVIRDEHVIAIKDLNKRYVILPRILILASIVFFFTFTSKVLSGSKKLSRIHINKIFCMFMGGLLIMSAYYSVDTSLVFSSNSSDVIYDFKLAASWLEGNLSLNELAIVPYVDVFNSFVPSLYNCLIDYSEIWALSGVYYAADTTHNDVLKVREFLYNFLKEKPEIKYLVVDRQYPQCNLLFNFSVYDQLDSVLISVINFPARSGFTDKLAVFRVAWPTEVFSYDLSKPNKQWSMLSRGNVTQIANIGYQLCSVQNDSGIWFNFRSIFASEREIGVNITSLSSEMNNLSIIIYYDVNGDGGWSGYELDKASSIQLIINSESIAQENSISKIVNTLSCPIVRLGVILQPDENPSVSKQIVISKVSLNTYSNTSIAVRVFEEAAGWFKENLSSGESAIVPNAQVFTSYVPQLKGQIIDFSEIWASSGFPYSANVTSADIQKIRKFLFTYLQETTQTKFIAVDELYPQSYLLFNNAIDDLLAAILVKEVDFPTSEQGSVDSISVYRVAWPEEILRYDFESIDPNCTVLTRGTLTHLIGAGYQLNSSQNDAIWFDLNSILGRETTIGINVTLSSIERNTLLVVAYLDENGDGAWSGYELDKVSSTSVEMLKTAYVDKQVVFLTLSKPALPIVRIGFILASTEDSHASSILLHGFSINVY